MFEPLKLIKMKNAVLGLAFSDNFNLGVVSGKCGYVFDQNGNLLNKICGNDWMNDVSYCCGKFGFVNYDGYAYITDENGNLIKKIFVKDSYSVAITVVENGFVVCGVRCAFLDFDGNEIWDVGPENGIDDVSDGPVYYNGYWYIPDWYRFKVAIMKDGEGINNIHYGEKVYSVAICDKYLAVGTISSLYLYDLSDPVNPKELWHINELGSIWELSFSPDCKYIAVANTSKRKLMFFDIDGRLFFEKKFGRAVYSVDWKNDKIAVGVGTNVYIYIDLPSVYCHG